MQKSAVRPRPTALLLAALAFMSFTGCSGGGTAASAAKESTPALSPEGLTPFQVDHGIGPLTTPVAVAASIDQPLAASGAKVFETKCSACHKMAERYVGPALADVTKRRTPTFVMNMMLNPLEMIQKHPSAKKLLAEYLVAMPNQNLTPEEARQVLEYLRSETP